MRFEDETEFRGNTPGDDSVDRTGSRIMGTFGTVLTLSTLVILAIFALVWWLTRA